MTSHRQNRTLMLQQGDFCWERITRFRMSRWSSTVAQRSLKSFESQSLIYVWRKGQLFHGVVMKMFVIRQTWKEPTAHSSWHPLNRPFPPLTALKQTIGLVSWRCKDHTLVDICNCILLGWPSIFRPRNFTFHSPHAWSSCLVYHLLFLPSSHLLLILFPFLISTGRVNSLWSQCFQGPQRKKISKGRINIICLKHDNKLRSFISNFALRKGWHETFEETWNRS